ncbi:TetR/AcrR family transcriptional regulator [Actinoplanes sichuanensis]|uniref:TetR/AcrR family transcriptional regulator n=1 Tax=Actinoplanes sichuanensis TaxID=512349 RepID=A0ABW4A8X5_9ACTN|nr:helix-turn-helix domain-containing protein [Actinoplanes sichuanensis]
MLEVAAEVFAAEGLAVPVHEIARRAGVGTGTVSRHFPTKEALFAAILLERMAGLTAEADELAEQRAPGEAFFRFFASLVRAGADNRGLAEALAGAGLDLDEAGAEAGHDVRGRLQELLGRAQQAGAVRADIVYPDLKALIVGCQAHPAADRESLDRIIDVVCAGLRTG